ncbi:MAG: DUF2092 domain-containing protein [Planctomycetota bacterium]|jgi:peroxiredoxin
MSRVCRVVFLVAVTIVTPGARAAEPPVAPTIDPQAERIVHALAAHYRAFDHGTADVMVSLRGAGGDASLKHDIAYALAIARPARFALHPRRGTDGGTIVSDGRTLTVLAPGGGAFVQTRAPRALSTVIDTVPDVAVVSAAGGMELDVLFGLLGSAPEKRLLEAISSIRHAGIELIHGVAADHLVFTQSGMDVHLWIQQGERPWLLRLRPDFSSVLKRRDPAGAAKPTIELTITYRNWSATAPSDTRFTFVPPATAQRVKSFLPALAASPTKRPRDTPVAGDAGQPAPEVTLELLGGDAVALGKERGRIVVLDFWATWCVPCVDAMAGRARIDRDFRDRGVELYMVNMAETDEQVRSFLQRRGFGFRVAMDRDGAAAGAFRVGAIPHTVVIRPDGRVHAVHGPGSNLEDTLRADIEGLLEPPDRPPAPRR